ncbi:hypothetical protein [Streptomyces sp. NPDC094147]
MNVTRIHLPWFQDCICQSDDGVALTSEAEVAPKSKTTRPPVTV